MKALSEYSSQELFDELKRREENFEILEINRLNFEGITIKDVVIKYGSDGQDGFLYAPHIKEANGALEFIYYADELKRRIMPSCFHEQCEGIYESAYSLEESLDILGKCGIVLYREDSFFDY